MGCVSLRKSLSGWTKPCRATELSATESSTLISSFSGHWPYMHQICCTKSKCRHSVLCMYLTNCIGVGVFLWLCMSWGVFVHQFIDLLAKRKLPNTSAGNKLLIIMYIYLKIVKLIMLQFNFYIYINIKTVQMIHVYRYRCRFGSDIYKYRCKL